MDLTPSQLAKKAEVEANGGVFLPPAQYKKQRISRAPKGQKRLPTSRGTSEYRHQMDNVMKHNPAAKTIYRQLHPESQHLVEQLLDPESSMDPQRWPNTYGLSAVFKTKNVIECKYSDNGGGSPNGNRSAVVVYPGLKGSICVTKGASTVAHLGPVDNTNIEIQGDNAFSFTSDVSLAVRESQPWAQPISFNNGGDLIFPQPYSNVDFDDFPPGALLYPISGPAVVDANFLSMRITGGNILRGELAVTTYLLDSTYTLVPGSKSYCVAAADATIGPFVINPTAAAFDYLAVYITAGEFSFDGDLSMRLSVAADEGIDYTLLNHPQHMIAYDLNNADTVVESGDEAIVVAQSLLLTYQGSTLNDTGSLAVARVPPKTIIGKSSSEIDSDTWYQFIASLPYNNHDGATRSGGYSWLLKVDEEGYFYKNIDSEDYSNVDYMCAEWSSVGTGDGDNGQPVRIRVDSICQFTTNSTVYAQAPSMYIGQDIEHIRFLLSNIPAAYENNTHIEQLKAMLKKIASSVVGVLKNPNTYTTAAQIAAMLL